MSRRLRTHQRKLGPPFLLSLVIHITVVVIFTQMHLFTPARVSEPVWYVDIADLPVANPQGGAPSAAPRAAPTPPSPPAPAAAPPSAMKLPSPPATSSPKPAQKTIQSKEAPPAKESAEEFEERLRRIEREADARHQNAALDALQRKVATAGKQGMPGATGKEAGSDYASYIRSRLEDAFRHEDTFKPDRAKVMAVLLTVNRNGRIGALKVEQSSPDKGFNDAVMRAITRAEKEFRPPPGGGQVELKFIFKPQEVSKK